MSIKKQILKSKPLAKVSFKISKSEGLDAKKAFLVGDFNAWSETSHPLKALKDGSFSITIELETGREYQFRYLLDESTWINDSEADNLIPGGIGNEKNGIIIL